ncbi:MAG TPA: hypothetical protein VNI56_03540 [Xanthomonadaceae bacterium]|nr:hypothetical protein [Xanthomonadaceae bacterium]
MARFATVLCLLLLASTAQAQSMRSAPQWWGNLNIGSYHFGNEDEEFLGPGESFQQFNPGIGVEAQWQPRHAVAVGYFRNSVDENSLYALYHYTPLQLGRYVRVGGMIGAVTGYPGYNDGGIAPGGGFIAKIEGDRVGANLVFLPKISGVTPNTLGLQVKIRFGN